MSDSILCLPPSPNFQCPCWSLVPRSVPEEVFLDLRTVSQSGGSEDPGEKARFVFGKSCSVQTRWLGSQPGLLLLVVVGSS